jgi:hypothetical protein
VARKVCNYPVSPVLTLCAMRSSAASGNVTSHFPGKLLISPPAPLLTLTRDFSDQAVCPEDTEIEAKSQEGHGTACNNAPV